MPTLTAEAFLQRMHGDASEEQREKYKRFFPPDGRDVFVGVPMGKVFALAKEMIDMPPAEIEVLLDVNVHEARAGALSVMDKQARRRATPESRRKELYDLYLRRIERIDNWDLVDLAAIHVIGGYLADKPRDILYELARSENPWARRTAIVATFYFQKSGDLDDTYAIAELLNDDPHDLVAKSVGWALRAAGDHDRARLEAFLEQHAATISRVALRNAIEKFDKADRAAWLQRGKAR